MTPERITRFIKKHHVLTLATSRDNRPWTANCFYAWMDEPAAFVFTSENHTRHIQDLEQGNIVAGSVVLETRVVGRIRGIQFSGRLTKAGDSLVKQARRAYIRRFPYAAAMKPELWILETDYIKMTDNRLGFGKKLEWHRDNE